jgi:AcrR family transcriptional regulator
MPRPKDRDMRQEIVSSAIQLFGEKGFTGTTIKDLAAVLGIAPGSVYTYFTSKEELFRTSVEEGWLRFLEEIQRIVSAPRQLSERFESIIDYCFESLREALPLLRGMLFDARQRRLLEENLQRLCDLLEGLIRGGQDQGRLRTDVSEEQLRIQIRINVFGVLSSIALAQDEVLEQEISAVKSSVKHLFYHRLKLELRQ